MAGWVSAPASASADIYRYTDDQGVVHYSNRPPRGRRRGVQRLRAGKASPEATRSRAPRRRSTANSATSHSATSHRAGGRSSAARSTPSRWDSQIREAAALYQLPEAFLRAVMRVESNFQPEVVSSAGACGLMQLMPRTAARMGVTDVFDPRQNVLGGARYLRVLANAFEGDLVLTVAAYNAGEGAVIRYQGIPPYEETQRYVRRVLTHYYRYAAE